MSPLFSLLGEKKGGSTKIEKCFVSGGALKSTVKRF